ncbi:MAG: 6-bladed beta-propeller [Candidatus Aminicenantes bacterium]|nr:6-bladed beta-propeller [Candidatus Aminicenantes bacterium]
MKKAVTIFTCFLLLFACQKQAKIDRATENGAEVVLNHLQPYSLQGESGTLLLERIFSIDTEKEDLLKAGLTDIETFDVDQDGHIFILQWQSKDHFVFKFSPDGRLLNSFLRFGQGPGELEYGGKILISPQNEVLAKDPSKTKFLVYDRDGRFLRETRLDKTYSPVPLANGRYFIFWGDDTPEWRKQFVGLYDAESKSVNVLDTFQYPNVMNTRSPVNRDLLVYHVAAARIFIGNTTKGYEIQTYDLDGNLLRKIRKEFAPVLVTDQLKNDYFKLWPADDPMKNNLYFTENWPPFRGLFADDEGRLFVLTYEAGINPGEFMYDIFNPEGIFIGRLSLANMKNLFRHGSFTIKMKKKSLYALQEKENGYKELVVYRMTWK